MRELMLAFALVMAMTTTAGAIECKDWDRLPPEQKGPTVERLIDQRLNSNVAKRYTSANRVAIRKCAMRRVQDIQDEFDGTCAEGIEASMNALDEIFDRYFLSCVQ